MTVARFLLARSTSPSTIGLMCIITLGLIGEIWLYWSREISMTSFAIVKKSIVRCTSIHQRALQGHTIIINKREGWQTNENSYLLDWRLPLFRSGRSRGLVLPPTPSPPLISPTWKNISQYKYVVSNIQDLGFLPSFGWKWSRIWIPHICHGRHGRRPCKFFWPV